MSSRTVGKPGMSVAVAAANAKAAQSPPPSGRRTERSDDALQNTLGARVQRVLSSKYDSSVILLNLYQELTDVTSPLQPKSASFDGPEDRLLKQLFDVPLLAAINFADPGANNPVVVDQCVKWLLDEGTRPQTWIYGFARIFSAFWAPIVVLWASMAFFETYICISVWNCLFARGFADRCFAWSFLQRCLGKLLWRVTETRRQSRSYVPITIKVRILFTFTLFPVVWIRVEPQKRIFVFFAAVGSKTNWYHGLVRVSRQNVHESVLYNSVLFLRQPIHCFRQSNRWIYAFSFFAGNKVVFEKIDAATVFGLLRTYIQSLPDPLLTRELFSDIVTPSRTLFFETRYFVTYWIKFTFSSEYLHLNPYHDCVLLHRTKILIFAVSRLAGGVGSYSPRE